MLLFSWDLRKGRQTQGSDCFKFGEGAGCWAGGHCGRRGAGGLSTLQWEILGLVPAPLSWVNPGCQPGVCGVSPNSRQLPIWGIWE